MATQPSLFTEVPKQKQRPLAVDGWYECLVCYCQFKAGSGLPPHSNECPQFRCTRCGVLFAFFPNPEQNRYGDSPKCSYCLVADGERP